MAPIHALVIGIDNYPAAPAGQRTLFPSLGGCVRDALEVDAFLRDRLGVPESQITRLLSPLPGVDARGAALPTYDNIVRAWQRLIEQVPSGEQIYIHYAGHGGRVKTCVPEAKGDAALDEALAPCDINDRANGRFLRDVEIAHLLDVMTERGQVGTIVVDACHSGGLRRGSDAVARRGEGDDLAPRASDALGSAVGTRTQLEAAAQHVKAEAPAQRGGGARGVEDAWHFAPSSTVVLAACRQNESAYEYAFDGYTKRGALTYFWLQALERRGPSLTYGEATRRIVADIAPHQLAQRPMALGDTEREVLGLRHVRPAPAIAVIAVNGDRVTLSAGLSGLMRRGMRLAIAPPNATAGVAALAGLPEVEVIEVGAATSVARRIGDSGGEIAGGALAIPLRYTESATRRVKWQPSGLAGDDDAARAVMQAVGADPSNLLAAATGDAAAHYLVTQAAVAGARAYRIDDASGNPIANLRPAISVAEPDAAARVVERLAHLARFGLVQMLDNSDSRSPLTGRVEIELLALQADYESGEALQPRPFPGGQPERIPHDTWFCMRLHNRTELELNVVVLDLQPDWGISKAVPSDMPWLQLAPGTYVDTAIRAWLPAGYGTSTDTLKAIATIEPAEFNWLCLDALDELGRRRGARKGIASDDLHDAMEAMRSATRATRNVHTATVPTLGWTTVKRALIIEAPDVQRQGA